MALGLMFLMIQSAVAVTLPTTSYTPSYASEEFGTGSGVVFGSGTIVTGSYRSLGAIDPDVCTGSAPGIPKSGTSCSNCCSTAAGLESCIDACVNNGGDPDECEESCGASTGYDSCVSSCNAGPSLPLDGGLSILLALALGSGAFRAFRVFRKK